MTRAIRRRTCCSFGRRGARLDARAADWLKPATISFGQSLRSADLDRAASAAARADLVVALGSTLSVHPAASVPLLAAQRGTPYIIVNRGETDHDDLAFVTMRLEGDVTAIFPAAVNAALGPLA